MTSEGEKAGTDLEQFQLRHGTERDTIGIVVEKGYDSKGSQPKLAIFEEQSSEIKPLFQVLTHRARKIYDV